MTQMNCVSEVQSVRGLRPRRLKNLKRPTKQHPVLGTLELVREERCHCWQLSHQFVKSRVTIIDEIIGESQDLEEAESFMAELAERERRIREKVLRARYFEFLDENMRDVPFGEILERCDDWMVPFRVNRWGNGVLVYCDCADAPGGKLLGAAQIDISLDQDWSIASVTYFTTGVAQHLRMAAYRQRVIPAGCGFVADCIADQFILSSPDFSPELAELLTASIEQTEALLGTASQDGAQFLRCALGLLCEFRDKFS